MFPDDGLGAMLAGRGAIAAGLAAMTLGMATRPDDEWLELDAGIGAGREYAATDIPSVSSTSTRYCYDDSFGILVKGGELQSGVSVSMGHLVGRAFVRQCRGCDARCGCSLEDTSLCRRGNMMEEAMSTVTMVIYDPTRVPFASSCLPRLIPLSNLIKRGWEWNGSSVALLPSKLLASGLLRVQASRRRM